MDSEVWFRVAEYLVLCDLQSLVCCCRAFLTWQWLVELRKWPCQPDTRPLIIQWNDICKRKAAAADLADLLLHKLDYRSRVRRGRDIDFFWLVDWPYHPNHPNLLDPDRRLLPLVQFRNGDIHYQAFSLYHNKLNVGFKRGDIVGPNQIFQYEEVSNGTLSVRGYHANDNLDTLSYSGPREAIRHMLIQLLAEQETDLKVNWKPNRSQQRILDMALRTLNLHLL